MSSQCLATTTNVPSFNSPKSHFVLFQRPKISFSCYGSPWNIGFSTLTKSHLCMVKRPIISSKWLMFHSTAWIFSLSSWKKAHYWLIKKQKMTSKCHSTTWINVFRVYWNRILGRSIGRKLVRSVTTRKVALLTSPKSLFGLVQMLKINWKGHKPLKHRVFDLNQVVFWDGLEADYEFKVTCEPLKHGFLDFSQVAFWAGIVEENEVLVNIWKIDFSTSSKLNVGLVKRQKMCNSTTWIVALSTL